MRNCFIRCASVLGIVVSLSALTIPVFAQGFGGVLTYHNDIARTGQNLYETILSPENVNSSTFGRLFAYPVDGPMWAEPLYVPNVSIPGQGSHNVVYLATENDGVYAFDADGKSTTPLWYVSLINPAAGITAVPCQVMAQTCNVYPVDGITGTPVIDPSTDTIYLVAQTVENGVYYQRLHALDITTGAEKFGGPTVIQGSVSNKKGTLIFDPQHNLPRPGLLLLNGKVYLAWAGDTHGWLAAYDATTLQQTAMIASTPNGNLGGLWASGGGIMSDGTNVYVEAGDGTFDLNNGGLDFGDSIVKLDPNTLKVLDYFTPGDQNCRRLNDMDLGSGGPMLLPTQPGTYPNEILVSGKGGDPCDTNAGNYESPVYLVDRDNLGGYGGTNIDLDIQTIYGAPYGYHSSPAYFQGPSSSYVYLAGLTSEGGTGDYLKQFSLTDGLLSTVPAAQSATNFVIGATPSVSANGTANGILWAQERRDILSSISNIKPSILYALDANNVATTYYSSDQGGARDQAGPATKFQVPTIANGKVYLATLTELDVYGLLSGQSATTTALSTSANPTFGQPVTLTAKVTAASGTPTGSVDFFLKNGYNLVGVGTISGNQASVTLTGLATGAHTYDATYNGSGAFGVSSGAITFAVAKAPTTTTINSSSQNPSNYGQSVTFTATVTSNAGVPTGSVTFKRGNGVLGSGTLSGTGVATYTTTATQLVGGKDPITASYSPDQNHAASTSAVLTQSVLPIASSTAFTASPNPASVGQTVTLTATLTSTVGTPGGNVIFKNGNTALGTVALVNGVATMTTSFSKTGSYSLKAAYQGSANYDPSSQTLTQKVQ